MPRWLSTAVILCTVLFCLSPYATAAQKESILAQWEFNTDGDFQGWTAGGQVAEVAVAGGALRGKTTGNDPILFGPTFEIPARPAQCVEIRMKTTATSHGQLFWTQTLEGPYGGFSQEKANVFQPIPDGQFHVYRIHPFWQAAGKIIRFRLDPPNDGPFEIDWIRVIETPQGAPTTNHAWQFTSDAQGWWSTQELSTPTVGNGGGLEVTTQGKTPVLGSPLLSVPAVNAAVACIRMAVSAGGSGRVYYASSKRIGWDSVSFPLRADGRVHTYNVELPEVAERGDELVFIGIAPSDVEKARARIESIQLAEQPSGPAELEVSYFGPTEAVNRVGRPAPVVCTLRNLGGQLASGAKLTLSAPEGVKIVGDATQTLQQVSFDFPESVCWSVEAAGSTTAEISLKVEVPGQEAVSSTAAIQFTPIPQVAKTDYIPEPRPVTSKLDIGTFYFPGWPTMKQWQPILDYPLRKPVLGWYDEANPECIDWQIKWAVEHGVKFFLVDWYWHKENRHLEHWVQSFEKAKYRKYLKWCVMWANHNPPNSHSVDDWRKVTQYWIDHCFGQEEYYRVDGRPAVFIWAPSNVRGDLGGAEKAAELYAMSQKMARDAGYPGVYFAAMGAPVPDESTCRALETEGFEAFTSYHAFQIAQQRAKTQRFPYADVVATTPEVWRDADKMATKMEYFPLLDTGWSSEPWHGSKSLSIYGRTPELLGELCRQARRYAEEHRKKIVILGPWNEWGEGSYIEPCTEYGFRCLDEIRSAFCEPGDYPPNLTPADVGRGPYDLPLAERKTDWQFDTEGQFDGWSASQMEAAVRGGALVGKTTGSDPILSGPGLRVDATRVRHLTIRMKCSADDRAQVFFATRLAPQSEANSVHFKVIGDGQFHDYELDMGANPRWRGVVTSLRIDPVVGSGREFSIEEIRLHQ